VQSISASIEAACPKTLQQVNRDFGAQSPAPKISVKNYMSAKPARLFVMYTLQPRFWALRIQIARSESEKAEEDRDQATNEQRYTKRNATSRRVFW
jgi:hypothetical protein